MSLIGFAESYIDIIPTENANKNMQSDAAKAAPLM